MDSEEKRNRLLPIPGDLRGTLNESQLMAIRRLESFGWELRFVRRNGLAAAIPVVTDASGRSSGILEPDGSLNVKHNLKIRP